MPFTFFPSCPPLFESTKSFATVLFFDDISFYEKVELLPDLAGGAFGALDDLLGRKRLALIEQEEAEQSDFCGATEKGGESIHEKGVFRFVGEV